jgi:hypothetical protein
MISGRKIFKFCFPYEVLKLTEILFFRFYNALLQFWIFCACVLPQLPKKPEVLFFIPHKRFIVNCDWKEI